MKRFALSRPRILTCLVGPEGESNPSMERSALEDSIHSCRRKQSPKPCSALRLRTMFHICVGESSRLSHAALCA